MALAKFFRWKKSVERMQRSKGPVEMPGLLLNMKWAMILQQFVYPVVVRQNKEKAIEFLPPKLTAKENLLNFEKIMSYLLFLKYL